MEFLWWVLVVEAGGDVRKEGLMREPRGESGCRGGGQGVRVPGRQVRLVLRQRRGPVVVGKVMSSSSSSAGLVGLEMVGGGGGNLPAGLVLAAQVERGHRLVVRGGGE